MKRALIGSCAWLAMSSAAFAQVPTVWQGEAVIETVTAACRGNADYQRHIRRGDVYRMVFRPGGLPDNGADNRVSFVSRRSIVGYRLSGTALTGGYVGQQFNSVGGAVVLSPDATRTYNLIQVTPEPTVATPYVLLRGTIDRFFNIENCSVRFRAGLTKRP